MSYSKETVIKKNQDFFKNLPFNSDEDTVHSFVVGKYILKMPLSALSSPQDIFHVITGGCGPGDFGDKLVPDTLWGLSVRPACKIHDWTFQVWSDNKSFKVANDLFLENMYLIIGQHGGFKWLQALRRMRARKYHYFVTTKRGKKAYKDNHLEYIL